jgi:peptidoglycan/LPS O-acetylase OafA/YrhL
MGYETIGEHVDSLPLLDLLRILASVAVVRHHMRADFMLGVGFGLPLFLMLFFGLSSSSTREEPLALFARRKARHLLVPWLRWSAIYLAVMVLSDVARGREPFGRLEPAMLWYGGHASLWFLPFAAVALIALRLLLRVAVRLPVAAAVLGAASLGALWGALSTELLALDLPDMPVRAWLRVSPGLFWGLALGQSLRARTWGERRGLLLAVGLIAVAFALGAPSGGDQDGLALRYAVAVPLACAGFAASPRVPALARSVASLCFGIYLVHPLVGKVLGACFDVFSWPAAVHAGAGWLGSAAVVAVARKLGVPWHEFAPQNGRARSNPSSADTDPPEGLARERFDAA